MFRGSDSSLGQVILDTFFKRDAHWAVHPADKLLDQQSPLLPQDGESVSPKVPSSGAASATEGPDEAGDDPARRHGALQGSPGRILHEAELQAGTAQVCRDP